MEIRRYETMDGYIYGTTLRDALVRNQCHKHGSLIVNVIGEEPQVVYANFPGQAGVSAGRNVIVELQDGRIATVLVSIDTAPVDPLTIDGQPTQSRNLLCEPESRLNCPWCGHECNQEKSSNVWKCETPGCDWSGHEKCVYTESDKNPSNITHVLTCVVCKSQGAYRRFCESYEN